MSGAEPFLLAAGTAISAVGAIQSANAQSAAFDREAQIADRNKILADQDRQLAVRTAQIAAEDKNRENRRRLADLRASMGASGLEMAGSPIDLLADTSLEMALDTKRIEFEGKVRNREGVIEMLNFGDQAAGARMSSKSARRSGYYSAGGALLSGGAKAYGSFEEQGYFD